jgi:prephenate dehydrogenase
LKKKRLARQVWGLGRDPKRLLSARRRGLVDAVATDLGIAHDADLIVLCTPFERFEQDLEGLAQAAPEGCLVTDVGSVKGAAVARWERAAGRLHFVASHPMAGGELGGFEHARADLFKGAAVLLTPTRRTRPAALRRVSGLWRAVGARVARTTPGQHDSLVGRLSHLPHAAAFALMAQIAGRSRAKDFAFAGKGFLDSTRIAASDAALWKDIFLHHPQFVRQELKGLRRQLATLEALLRPAKARQLQAWLGRISAARRMAGRQAGA